MPFALWLSSRHMPLLAAIGYLGIFLLVYGFYFIDIPSLAQLHGDPYARLPAAWEFLHSSVLGPLIGHHLGIDSGLTLRLFYCSIIGVFLIALYLRLSALAKSDGRTFVVLLSLVVLAPYAHTLLSWIGKPDPLIMLLFLAFMASDSFVVRNGMVFLMLLAHREIACFMLLIWAILYRVPWRGLLALLPGALLGIVWYACYSYALGGWADRADYVASNLGVILTDGVTGFPVIIMLTFSWFWGVLGALMIVDRPHRWRIVLAALVAVSIAFAALDHTRVPITAAFPLVLFALERIVALGWITPLCRFVPAFFVAGLVHVEYNTGVLVASHWPLLIRSHYAQICEFLSSSRLCSFR